jgi:hypothetical protein
MPYVYINPYKSSYLAAQQELEQRKQELIAIRERISQLEQTIKTLAPLAEGDAVPPTQGLPSLCRLILMSEPGLAFTANEVMERLANMGVDISGYAQPLAVLHTTLSRLVRPGSGFTKVTRADGQLGYVCMGREHPLRKLAEKPTGLAMPPDLRLPKKK